MAIQEHYITIGAIVGVLVVGLILIAVWLTCRRRHKWLNAHSSLPPPATVANMHQFINGNALPSYQQHRRGQLVNPTDAEPLILNSNAIELRPMDTSPSNAQGVLNSVAAVRQALQEIEALVSASPPGGYHPESSEHARLNDLRMSIVKIMISDAGSAESPDSSPVVVNDNVDPSSGEPPTRKPTLPPSYNIVAEASGTHSDRNESKSAV